MIMFYYVMEGIFCDRSSASKRSRWRSKSTSDGVTPTNRGCWTTGHRGQGEQGPSYLRHLQQGCADVQKTDYDHSGSISRPSEKKRRKNARRPISGTLGKIAPTDRQADPVHPTGAHVVRCHRDHQGALRVRIVERRASLCDGSAVSQSTSHDLGCRAFGWDRSTGARQGQPGPQRVLFLDELPNFRRSILEVMRQRLEDGKVTISRAAGSLTFPSEFMLVALMNPCPCRHYGDLRRECRCAPPRCRSTGIVCRAC
jgi:hypothetical protein